MSASEPLIKVNNLHKYYGEKIVHRGISFELYKGEVLTLMGGSGVGKSVILRCLIGLEKPERGEIFFHEKNIVSLNEEELVEIRKKIAFVFQFGALFDSLSVFENVAYPLREHTNLSEDEISKKVKSILELLSLSGSEELLPSDLSGGMQRRVGVARSIIMEPEVILYDEPTTGLDPYNIQQILKIIVTLKNKGITSILVTHDMASIFTVTDRIAFLKDGLIYALGTKEEIRDLNDPVVQSFIKGESMK